MVGHFFGEMMAMFAKRTLIAGTLVVCCLSLARTSALQATLIAPELLVTGEADFDESFALADGTVTQTGSYYVREGGLDTQTTYSGITTIGSDPLPGRNR